MNEKNPRVAIVHDWLYTVGGAERVLRGILRCFPDADVHCLFDVLEADDRRYIGYERANTSFLQRMPGISRNHRHYLPLMPMAIEQFDLSRYDLVISSSFAVAKGVLTGPDQLHVSYVHSPMRYAWDLQHRYLKEARLERGMRSGLARLLLHRMRIWDARTASGVDRYVANSAFVARRLRKLYGCEPTVIHPPVRISDDLPPVPKESFFLTASRLVPYKNVRVLIDAFAQLPDQRLVVAGTGPDYERLRSHLPANVAMLGFVDDAALRTLMASARAFLFAAEEDFGIVPVEAQACGTPVIALGRGGALETVVAEGPGATGLFFAEAEPALVVEAVKRFIASEHLFSAAACRRNAARFSEERFEREFRRWVLSAYAEFDDERRATHAVGAPLPPSEAAELAHAGEAADPRFHPSRDLPVVARLGSDHRQIVVSAP